MPSNTKTQHYKTIQKKVCSRLSDFKLDCFLITSLPHVRYISGFSGSAGLCLVFNNSKYFITDKRYTEQAAKEISGWKIIPSKNDLFETIAENNLIPNNSRIGIDGNHLTFAQYQNLKKIFHNHRVLPKAGFIEEVAIVKDAYEIEQITKAVEISDQVFLKILNIIKPGIRELDISAEITFLHKKCGAERDAFEPIVASGKNSALPHAKASKKIICKGDIVTLDFGCVVSGYHSDLTRTIFIGEPKRKAIKIYQTVLEADKISQERYHGHGSAIAQIYNHIIMPLANDRDKYTQICWGIKDFQARFRRYPEGMWLPETAVDYRTLEIMADL
ncbi:MAG: M24 family metallopeptidase, partial [Bacillota bacterium]|nr:M24 family metallopeptidase [Bacillota bacterium]